MATITEIRELAQQPTKFQDMRQEIKTPGFLRILEAEEREQELQRQEQIIKQKKRLETINEFNNPVEEEKEKTKEKEEVSTPVEKAIEEVVQEVIVEPIKEVTAEIKEEPTPESSNEEPQEEDDAFSKEFKNVLRAAFRFKSKKNAKV